MNLPKIMNSLVQAIIPPAPEPKPRYLNKVEEAVKGIKAARALVATRTASINALLSQIQEAKDKIAGLSSDDGLEIVETARAIAEQRAIIELAEGRVGRLKAELKQDQDSVSQWEDSAIRILKPEFHAIHEYRLNDRIEDLKAYLGSWLSRAAISDFNFMYNVREIAFEAAPRDRRVEAVHLDWTGDGRQFDIERHAQFLRDNEEELVAALEFKAERDEVWAKRPDSWTKSNPFNGLTIEYIETPTTPLIADEPLPAHA